MKMLSVPLSAAASEIACYISGSKTGAISAPEKLAPESWKGMSRCQQGGERQR
jgi:hypothetical protein